MTYLNLLEHGDFLPLLPWGIHWDEVTHLTPLQLGWRCMAELLWSFSEIWVSKLATLWLYQQFANWKMAHVLKFYDVDLP
jgi:hypothetical protein